MSFRSPNPGALVDNKYRLAERIGGGGMGDVFRAEQLNQSRPVAIKFLHPELSQNAEVAQRFYQEAQAVNRIRHPNVVDVIEVGVSEMGPYMVMEYLDGESVGSALTRVGRFEVEAVAGTAIPVLEALDAAHRVGIIHRDLKPENVFIALDATRTSVLVRLLDFGIAKILDAGEPGPRTRTGVVFGTPDYLSPEQATGEGPLDGRSDLFAVGVLIYELVTGMRPFRAPTAVATAFKVVHADAPSIAAAGVHVDNRLEAIVHRLLQKEPSKRFPTASDVIRELDRLSPDPARRAVALARVVGVSRRLALGTIATTQESERVVPGSARDASPTKRLTPDVGMMATQAAPRLTVGGPRSEPGTGRISDTPRSPRGGSGEGAKTMRSQLAGGSPAPASGDPPARASLIRPFPPRFAGRFQVRGPVLRSVDKAITDLFGAKAREDVVAQLPGGYAAEFRSGSINALVAYELEALDAYMEYASTMLVRDPARWREIGRLGVDGELHNVVRTLLRPTVDLGSVIRRGISTWARLFSFGAWRVGSSPNGKVTLTISEFDAVAQPLRQWVVGVVEQTARRAVRADVRAVITGGDQDFTPEICCEIS